MSGFDELVNQPRAHEPGSACHQHFLGFQNCSASSVSDLRIHTETCSCIKNPLHEYRVFSKSPSEGTVQRKGNASRNCLGVRTLAFSITLSEWRCLSPDRTGR